MKYQVIKLDGRHSHSGSFAYVLEFAKNTIFLDSNHNWGHSTGVLDFDCARRWMNRTYGWTQDVETRASIKRSNLLNPAVAAPDAHINQHWAYSVVYKDYRIYLASAKELTFFQLTHCESGST